MKGWVLRLFHLVRPWLPYALPVLLFWLGYGLAVRPLLNEGERVRNRIAEVRSIMDAEKESSRILDSLRTLRKKMELVEDSLSRVARLELPGPDSVVSMAGTLGIGVDAMEVSASENSHGCVSRRLRLVATGSALSLIRFLDTLQASPRLRLERTNWERSGGGFSLRPLELRLWDSCAVDLQNASVDSLAVSYMRFLSHGKPSKMDSAALIRLFGIPSEAPAPARPMKSPSARPSANPPPVFSITGIVAGRMANCVDSKDNHLLLKPGVQVMGWTVESIDARSVTLAQGDLRHVVQGK